MVWPPDGLEEFFFFHTQMAVNVNNLVTKIMLLDNIALSV